MYDCNWIIFLDLVYVFANKVMSVTNKTIVMKYERNWNGA